MKRIRQILAFAAALAPAIACGGCYSRVVSAEGLGANGADVQPTYRSDTALDRAWDSMFGPPAPVDRSKRWVDPQYTGVPKYK